MKSLPVRHIVSKKTLQPGAAGFSIRDLKLLLNGKELIHNLHRHDFYFVLAVLNGNGTHSIDFIEYPVHDHSIFILRPGQVHKLELSANTTGFLTEFDLSFYQPKHSISEQRWKKASSKNYCKIEAARFEKLLSYLAAIYDEFIEEREGFDVAIKANLDLFFLEYIRQSQNSNSVSKTESGYLQDRFEELMHKLETNIFSMKNVSQYAELLSLSPYQLNAITKAVVGQNVSKLIDDQIVLEAKRYLLSSSAQVKEVADHLGYDDPSYFIRFFKKHTGMSPDAFRKSF